MSKIYYDSVEIYVGDEKILPLAQKEQAQALTLLTHEEVEIIQISEDLKNIKNLSPKELLQKYINSLVSVINHPNSETRIMTNILFQDEILRRIDTRDNILAELKRLQRANKRFNKKHQIKLKYKKLEE